MNPLQGRWFVVAKTSWVKVVPQALWDKADALSAESIQWHMIGHLQRNKVKRTLPYCTLIHSIDSIRLLESVALHAAENEAVANCLLEVNVSGETAKHGFASADIETALASAAEMPSVRICGLMAMASLAGGAEDKSGRICSTQRTERQTRQFQGRQHFTYGVVDGDESRFRNGYRRRRHNRASRLSAV